MSRLFFAFCIVSVMALHAGPAYAQQPSLGCNDKGMRLQAEQMKRDFTSQGLMVYKDAMISMESKQPCPIAIQLRKGKLYQMIFIGSSAAKKMKLELFDGQDNKIDERELKIEGTQNFIVYSFTPEKSDDYLAVLTQVKGVKSMCGSFTIMQSADASAKQPPSKPVPPKPEKANPRYVPGSQKR